MKRVLALLAGVSLLSFSTVYAKGPHGGGPAGPKPGVITLLPSVFKGYSLTVPFILC